MYRSNEELFKHIFDEIVFLESETMTISKEVFLKDEKTQRAFARSIEIIGEAVKNISMKLCGMLQKTLFLNLRTS